MFWVFKKQPHRDGSFEYPQYMFWLRNKKNYFQLHTFYLEAYMTLNKMFFSNKNINIYLISEANYLS